MTTATLILVALILVSIVVGLGYNMIAEARTQARAPRYLPGSWTDSMIRRRVIVNLRSGESITGWLGDAWEDAVIVKSPEHIAPDGTRTPMDGRAVVPRAEVTFVQDVAE